MSLAVAFQMDPITSVDIDADSTFRLALEAEARGHRLYYYHVEDLSWTGGRVSARGRTLSVRRDKADPVTLGPWETRDLGDLDVVWLRQDPPFDMSYITNTHLLERIHPETLVVNDPFWVRNSPEKLLVLDFADLMPPTMVARSLEDIRAFRIEHGDIIVKPLYGNGGAGVFRLRLEDGNLASLHEMFTGINREPLMIQKFLPGCGGGRQARDPGRWRGGRCDQPRAPGGRDPVEHACGRQARAGRDDRARPRDLCALVTGVEGTWADLHRHRRDRRLADRDQCHLAHGHPGTRALRRHQCGCSDLGCDRASTGRLRSMMRVPRRALNAALKRFVKPSIARLQDPLIMRRQLEAAARQLVRDPPGARYRDLEGPRVPCLEATARGSEARLGTILYLHGGAYLAGSPRTHRHLAAALAGAAGLRACLPDYRLAPEHKLPAALEDALTVYRWLVAEGGPVALAGDSAGGGLAFALLGEILREGLPPPAAVVAFSPWCDMTGHAASLIGNARSDVMLPAVRLEDAVALCLGDGDPADPRVSPALGVYPTPPPALIFASEDEILRDDAAAMAAALERGGGAVTLIYQAGLPHAWPVFRGWLAAADRTVAETGAFLRGVIADR